MRLKLKSLTLPALGLNLFVILWGAYVRASGSGAGCGSHWPLCNGEVIPQSPSFHTLIEFTHRATSGLCLLLALIIAVLAWRENPRGTPLRRAGVAVLLLTLTEALVGAGLVLFGWVDKNQSTARVVSICLHLINTFGLMAALTLTHWWSRHRPRPSAQHSPTVSRSLAWGSALLVLLLGVTGAIAALGDTLFKVATLSEGVRQDFQSGAHFLVRLRAIHPVLAIAVAAFLLVFARRVAPVLASRGAPEARIAKAIQHTVATQLIVGMFNLGLLAPTGLQILHLALAQILWMGVVVVCFGDSEH